MLLVTIGTYKGLSVKSVLTAFEGRFLSTAGSFTLDYKSLTIFEKQVRYRLGLGFLFVFLPNHHFHKDHDATCLPPALKFCVPVLWILEHAGCHRHNPLNVKMKRLCVI